MFKRTLIPLIAIASSLQATEEVTTPAISTVSPAEEANIVQQTDSDAESDEATSFIAFIIDHLERGMELMEQDTEKIHEEHMRIVADTARTLLVKLMALITMKKLNEYGVQATQVHALYRAYTNFAAKVEATYGAPQTLMVIESQFKRYPTQGKESPIK